MTPHLPPEITEAHLTSEILGFGTGLALLMLTFGLLRRGAGQQSNTRARYHQAAIGLMWYLGGLLWSLLYLFGLREWRALLLAANVMNFTGAAFFPSAFLAMWLKPSGEQSTRTKACRILCRVSIISAVALTMSFIVTMLLWYLRQESYDHFINLLLVIICWHVAIVMGLGAWLLLPGRLNDFVSRFYAITTLIGACAPAVATLVGNSADQPPLLWLALRIIEHQSPLLITLGAIVFFADFRYSNVFVKGSLQLLTALLLALVFSLLITGPLPELVNRMTSYPTSGLVSVTTIILVAFVWAFLRLNPILSRLVDRRLFREPDYAAASRGIWEELSSQDGAGHDFREESERIFLTVARFVRQTLELEEVGVAPISVIKADQLTATLNSGEVCELRFDDPVKWKLGAGVEFLAPVRVNGRPTHLLTITPGARRRQLLESEISFVRTVAGQVSSRLEALQFEQEKADRQNKEERLRRQVSEAELRALRAQINPHFLFNSLNTIADLIVADPARAEQMTVQLAKVFRHVLSNSDRQLITIGEELEFLRTYLDIEAVRFGDRMRLQFDIDANAATESVPSLILQPVVENALKHGLAQKVGGGTLQISVKREDGFLRLVVEDDGPGFSARAPVALEVTETGNGASRLLQTQKQRGHGVGLRNITERLATIYSGQAKILFENRPDGGSRVTLLLPRQEIGAV
jgi:two-component system, LytTR family, sensor kinase